MPKDKQFEGAVDSIFDFVFSQGSKKKQPSGKKSDGIKLEGLANAGELAETLTAMASAPAVFAGETVAGVIDANVGGTPLVWQYVGKPDMGKYANFNPQAGRVRIRLRDLGSLGNVRATVESAAKKLEQENNKAKLFSLFGAGQVADHILALSAANRTGVKFSEAWNLGRANAYFEESSTGGPDLREEIIKNQAAAVAMSLAPVSSASDAKRVEKRILNALGSGPRARMARYLESSGAGGVRLKNESQFKNALRRQGFSSSEADSIVSGMVTLRSKSVGAGGAVEFNPGTYRDSVLTRESKKAEVLQRELERALRGDISVRDAQAIRKELGSSYQLQNLVTAMKALGGSTHNYSFSFEKASGTIQSLMRDIPDTASGRRLRNDMRENLRRIERAKQRRINSFGYNEDKFQDTRHTWRDAVRNPYFRGGQYTQHWKDAQLAVIDAQIEKLQYDRRNTEDPMRLEILQVEIDSLIDSKSNVQKLTRPWRRTLGDLQTSYGLIKDFMQGNMFNLSQIIGGSAYYDVPKAPGSGNYGVNILSRGPDGGISWKQGGVTTIWNDTGSKFTDNINKLLVRYGYHWGSVEGHVQAILGGSRALFRAELMQRDLVSRIQRDLLGSSAHLGLLKGYYSELFRSEGFASSSRFLGTVDPKGNLLVKGLKGRFGVDDPLQILAMLGDGTEANPWNEDAWAKLLGSDYLGVIEALQSAGLTGLSNEYLKRYARIQKLFKRGQMLGAPMRAWTNFTSKTLGNIYKKSVGPLVGKFLKAFGKTNGAWQEMVDQFIDGQLGIDELVQKGINMLLDGLGILGTGGLSTIIRFFLSQALSALLDKVMQEMLITGLYIMTGVLIALILVPIALLNFLSPVARLTALLAKGDRYIDPLDNRGALTEGDRIYALNEVEEWPDEWNAEYDCPITIGASCAQGAYGGYSHFHPTHAPTRELYAIDFTPTDWSHGFKAPTDLTLTHYDTENTECGGIAQFTDSKGNIFMLYHVRLLPPYNVVAGTKDEEDPLLGTSQIPKGAEIAWMQTPADFGNSATTCWDGTHFHLEIIAPSKKRYDAEQWMYEQCGNLVNKCPAPASAGDE
ncbi:hypothetical protein GF357_02375 [Candidatus Dojkabacteria bacterium]|nr:hypothetical protein [Candidatus Dojkabacteria bacterium]